MLPNKDLLIPGPWTVNGNKVTDAQGRTVAVCFARHATAHAYWVAALPQLSKLVGRDGLVPDRDREIDGLKAQIATLTDENYRLSEKLDDRADDELAVDELEVENEDLKARVAFLEAQVEMLRNQVVMEK